jgi:hypothetical protein
MFKQQSLGVKLMLSLMHNAPTMMFPWVIGTSFGFLVVPDVCKTKATLVLIKRGIFGENAP